MTINTNRVATVTTDVERHWILCEICSEAEEIVFVIETVCSLCCESGG